MRLSLSDLRQGAYVGIDRYARAVCNGWQPTAGQNGDDGWAHVVGAWGELAVAIATGYLGPRDLERGDRGAPDVGPYHVRTTKLAPPKLIIRPDDCDDEPFVLVVPRKLPAFEVVGWILGIEAKQAKYLAAPNGRPAAWFVPPEALRPIDGG